MRLVRRSMGSIGSAIDGLRPKQLMMLRIGVIRLGIGNLMTRL